jgi:uncharacterized membrane protein
MVREDPEALLRAMVAPLSIARRGEPLPGVPFSREAVANAFVMLGLLPEARAEEILAGYRPELEAKGFRLGVLTGELSVRPGAHGYQDALAASRDELTGIPLAVAIGPVPIAFGDTDLELTGATLTPGGVKLRLRAVIPDPGEPPRRPIRGRPGLQLAEETRFELPGQRFAAEVRSGLRVTDDLGRTYRLGPVNWGDARGEPGRRRWHGEVLAEPQPAGPATGGTATGGTATGGAVRWLEFAVANSQAVRVVMPPPVPAETGPAEPPWPMPAEAYLAELASVTSVSIATGDASVELDTAKIVAAVADALLWAGALPPDSAVLSERPKPFGWQEELAELWGRQANLRARDGKPERAGLAVALPLRRATAVIESIAAHGELVSVELYGHPWVSGEYWPMIAPSFQVRATDDTGAEHRGMPGSGGGTPECSRDFWFWPPVPPAAKRIRVTVSTLWEAAWAELAIPGRA